VDSGHTACYLDAATARIVGQYDSRSRWNRWLYHGLHSVDIPWLYQHRPAWDLLLLLLLLGGACLSISGVWLLGRVLWRSPGPATRGI